MCFAYLEPVCLFCVFCVFGVFSAVCFESTSRQMRVKTIISANILGAVNASSDSINDNS